MNPMSLIVRALLDGIQQDIRQRAREELPPHPSTEQVNDLIKKYYTTDLQLIGAILFSGSALDEVEKRDKEQEQQEAS